VPAPVSAKRHDGNEIVGTAGLDEQLPQQRVDAIGMPLERGAASRPPGDVRPQLVPRGIKRGAKRRPCGRRPAREWK
jgi:hypothetical protein